MPFNPDVICLCETWLTEYSNPYLISLPGYTLLRNDRGLVKDDNNTPVRGGGVAAYIKNYLTFRTIKISINKHINETEYIIFEIYPQNFPSDHILLGIVYRRPQGNYPSDFFSYFQQISHAYKHIIITGDLNANSLSPNSDATAISKLINDNALHQLDLGITHTPSNPIFSPSSIDTFIVDSPSKVVQTTTSPTPLAAGHHAIYLTYSTHTPKNKQTYTFRTFKNFDQQQANAHLLSQLNSIPPLTLLTPIDTVIDLFYKSITTTLDKFAPFITLTKKSLTPWLDPPTKTLMNLRDKHYKLNKKYPSPNLTAIIKDLNKRIKRICRNLKNQSIQQQLKLSTNTTHVWSTLKKAGLTRHQKSTSTTFFDKQLLNDHYCTIASQHPLCSDHQFQFLLNKQPIPSTQFFFTPVSNDLVYNKLKSAISKANSISPDNLPLKYLDKFIDAITPIFTQIINHSIATSSYPQLWKSALIIPINKILKPTSPNDTRPISNLSHLAKIYDSILTNQLSQYFETNKLFDRYQSGCRSGYSTQSALTYLLHHVRQGIEEGLVTVLVLFDLKKAFDTVDHFTLLSTLSQYNLSNSALKLLFTYLSQRSQAVLDTNYNHSTYNTFSSGIPQGSSPAGLLFNIHINPIASSLQYCMNSHLLFVDDFQIWLQCKPEDINVTIQNLNIEIKNIHNWFKSHRLTPNPQKSSSAHQPKSISYTLTLIPNSPSIIQ